MAFSPFQLSVRYHSWGYCHRDSALAKHLRLNGGVRFSVRHDHLT